LIFFATDRRSVANAHKKYSILEILLRQLEEMHNALNADFHVILRSHHYIVGMQHVNNGTVQSRMS